MATKPFVTKDATAIAAAALEAFRQHKGPGAFIVAVGGGAASGKSYLAGTLQRMLGEKLGPEAVALLKLDYFLGPGQGLEQGANWEGYKWGEFTAAVRAAREGRRLRVPVKDWESGMVVDTLTLKPGLKVLIAEGVGIFQDRLDVYYHTGFWVHCPPAERLRRGRIRSAATPHPDGGTYDTIHATMWPIWIAKDQFYEERHQPWQRRIIAGVFSNADRLPDHLLIPR